MKDFIFRNDTKLFSNMGVKMYYDGEITREAVDKIPCQTELDGNEVFELMKELIR